jgi:hypothetical protein
MRIPKGYSTGLIPRPYSEFPSGCYAGAPTFSDALILPEEQWEERLKEQKATKSGQYDLRLRYPEYLKSLNQDGLGLCWNFSVTKAVKYLMAIAGKQVDLSPWYIAGIINGWRDRGGWGAASLEKVTQIGIPELSLCPEYKKSYDTQNTRDNAAKHKVTEWWDGTESRDKNRAIMISCFLQCLPMALDYNHISHSMCSGFLESINPLVIYCDNSWSPSSGVLNGMMKLQGSKAIPDGIVVPRVPMVL